ncbi:hypothetical protein ACFPIJ_64330 [Dactylosporangium cerinum]|uniref:Restriction endonuclease type IV Mrr domain-containing protein n=1 Tax=Dactylosporangium cerinum TaxID=1434730 RepID=A0ABV9WNZ8_9ACTN
MKRIAPQAYEALVDALSVVFWNKAPFARHLRLALHEHPELLAQLDFTQYKRTVAGVLVQLMAGDSRYHQTVLQMMLDLAEFTTFPNLAGQVDGAHLIARAEAAVAQLKALTDRYRHDIDAAARLQAQRRSAEIVDAARQREAAALADLQTQFVTLEQFTDRQERGRRFEGVLYRLFDLYDMQPRMAYKLPHEQIDGSFSFDSDDFLLEAKWCRERIERSEADIFAAKIQRKGRNTLGLYVSISGFTEGFLQVTHPSGCPFITFDGDDLFLILDGRIALPEVIRRKRRHLNDTGNCHIPARALIA